MHICMVHTCEYYWGEPKRAPHLRVRHLPAYASGVVIYMYNIYLFSIFRPIIWATFSTFGTIVIIFEGWELFLSCLGHIEKD